MPKLPIRLELIIKVLCLALAGLVVYQLAGVAHRWNPFRGASVPELPVLTTAATSQPSPDRRRTNVVVATAGKETNNPARQSPTNPPPPLSAAQTNSTPRNLAGRDAMSQGAATTNSLVSTTPSVAGTNLSPHSESPSRGTNSTATATNALTKVVAKLELEHAGMNSVSTTVATNQGTNLTASARTAETNPVTEKSNRQAAGGMPLPGMPGMDFIPGRPPGNRGVDLPPAMQARIHQITESEILAPVIHPLPMALLGIAGEFAFLRSASGQTGLVKTGDSLDDLKLLRIGINRVLIELDGKKQELTIFDGYGGDSLMPNNSTNENNHP